jgi:hypothetical protein
MHLPRKNGNIFLVVGSMMPIPPLDCGFRDLADRPTPKKANAYNHIALSGPVILYPV